MCPRHGAKILHAELEVGGQMVAECSPDCGERAERLLGDARNPATVGGSTGFGLPGGRLAAPNGDPKRSSRAFYLRMFVDRFGIPWMVNHAQDH